MQLPRVTVLTCTRNYDRYISDAIQSVKDQTYPHELIRHIIIDDGSTDDTCQIVSDIFKSTSSIKSKFIALDENPDLSQRLGKGPSFARNIGIKETIEETDIYMILDADDIYLPDKIQRSVEVWSEFPEEIGVIYADYIIIHNDGYHHHWTHHPFDKRKLRIENIVHSNSLINVKALNKCGIYDEDLRTCEDYDLWLRISEKYIICHIPEVLMKVRVTGKNTTFTIPSERWIRDMNKVREKNGIK